MHIKHLVWAVLALAHVATAGRNKKGDKMDDCGHSTMKDTSTKDSPLTSDCDVLRVEALHSNRRFPVNYCGDPYAPPEVPRCYHRILSHKTCAFEARNKFIDYPSTIGGLDIADIVRDVTTKFGNLELKRVSAEGGEMHCKVSGNKVARPAILIDWRIVHT
ncbi:hypothetical protein B0T11DRAFT_343279 [Plectosphaerella cucumerina]|uniref:Ecp2 effector protein-like domain-containing protein n=1 Tax=Plectosphaerella cucumerina TaxID=40658 RepID=A0A8K0T6Z5_9PEZI|nr:hypothetical protein B0T11DRAFT_343279 [Plectosphaerella cucumerina]